MGEKSLTGKVLTAEQAAAEMQETIRRRAFRALFAGLEAIRGLSGDAWKDAQNQVFSGYDKKTGGQTTK